MAQRLLIIFLITFLLFISFQFIGQPLKRYVDAGELTKPVTSQILNMTDCSALDHPNMLSVNQIQGAGIQSPYVDKKVSTVGIVTLVSKPYKGFFIQSMKPDNDDLTSEGLFVSSGNDSRLYELKHGDKVFLQGKVAEYFGRTQLTDVEGVTVCGNGSALRMSNFSLPLKSALTKVSNVTEYELAMEPFEGMLISSSQLLTVSGVEKLTGYGELLVSYGRLMQSTDIVSSGSAAKHYEKANKLNQIVLDNGDPRLGYADVIINKASEIAQGLNVLKAGDTVSGINGVIHFNHNQFKIIPTEPVHWHVKPLSRVVPLNTNSHTVPNTSKSKPMLRIVSANIHNYFNGNGSLKAQYNGFPTKRGAKSLQQFHVQHQKLVAQLSMLDADIYGLIEIENDGEEEQSAQRYLVEALTAYSSTNKKPSGKGAKNYQFVSVKSINQSGLLGSDLIRVALIYDANKVETVGTATTLPSLDNQSKPINSAFSRGNRAPLIQSFKHLKSGKEFTLAVNHFKSKGGCPKSKSDPNRNLKDGQGCWNALRVKAADELAKHLQHPTYDGHGVLILGDLNAYQQEQPIMTLRQYGYQNAVDIKSSQLAAYSYIFRSRTGTLDYILLNKTAANWVNSSFYWHVNADVAKEYGYDKLTTENRLPASTHLRASDHDPVVLDLTIQ
ncbi:ExeM/NucH family extracellular endonuclease [Flocculibacter collagenilyticus]|uniref:ExeM/NucH family extracellular endonuclease n=1 Tax=Flocculibacter collagenilyticus TaxID=2744479 RepID=UPI0018F3A0C2|nr:ExeM/NucH family extracellular endonuclease [Flocculibacter collagenilyticus]